MDIEEELNKEELLRYAIDNGIIKLCDPDEKEYEKQGSNLKETSI